MTIEDQLEVLAAFRTVTGWPDELVLHYAANRDTCGCRPICGEGEWDCEQADRTWRQSSARLTSSDPEPPVGTKVLDALGRHWTHINSARLATTFWVLSEDRAGDAESWAKVAGNYGPVVVVGRAAP